MKRKNQHCVEPWEDENSFRLLHEINISITFPDVFQLVFHCGLTGIIHNLFLFSSSAVVWWHQLELIISLTPTNSSYLHGGWKCAFIHIFLCLILMETSPLFGSHLVTRPLEKSPSWSSKQKHFWWSSTRQPFSPSLQLISANSFHLVSPPPPSLGTSAHD